MNVICGIVGYVYPDPKPSREDTGGTRCASCGARTRDLTGFYCPTCLKRREDVARIMSRPETRPVTSFELDAIVLTATGRPRGMCGLL